MLPRRAPHRASWLALPAVSLLLAAACHARVPARELPRRVDLLAESAWAEVRASAVDLELLLSRPLLLHEGLDREGSSVWIARRARAATLRVPLSDARDRELRFVARSHESQGAIQTLVFWNGQPLRTVALTPTEAQHKLALPAAVQRAGENALSFEPQAAQDRPHAVGVSRLEVAEPDAPRPLAIPALVEGGFWLPPGSSLGFPLHEEPPAALRLAARAPGPAARLSASLGGRRALELAIPAGGSRDAAGELSIRPGTFERLEIVSHGPGGALVSALKLRTAERARPRPAALPVRPNLVIVVGDALRADSLGVYGHPGDISPRLDAFAQQQAVVFEEAWAQSSWTRPAIATLFTGLTPEAHGIDGVRKALSSAVPTLAEILKGAGYRTGAFVANDVLSPRLGYGRGFDEWRVKKVPARQVVEGALAWSEAGPAPFLLYVHTLEPHRPYQPDLEHWERFLPPGARPQNTKPLASRCPDLTGEEMALLRSAYQGEVRQNDAAFGALLDGLSARRFLDNTVVVFTADHGEAFGEHESCGHSRTLYREVLRVPLVFRLPVVAGRRERLVAQQADIMPTLLALAGLSAPEPLEGRDLSALILHGTPLAPSGVPLVSHLTYTAANKAAARLGRFKLVFNRERHPAGPRLELFDVAEDPAERQNIAEREPLVTHYLLGQLQSLRAAEGRLRQRLQTGTEVEPTAEEREALRALGYVQ